MSENVNEPWLSRIYGRRYYRDKRRHVALLSVKILLECFRETRAIFGERSTVHEIETAYRWENRESARRSDDIGWTVRSSSTAYARGGREQGVHLLETCSLYPLLIERSALGFTGVDWTHQQPLTVAPSRRPLPPTPPYIRKNMCMCLRACVRACVCERVCENERARQPKDAPKRCAQGRMVIPGVARTTSMCASRPVFPGVWVSYVPVCVPARTTPYWILDIERRWSSGRWTGCSGHEYEIFIHDFDR